MDEAMRKGNQGEAFERVPASPPKDHCLELPFSSADSEFNQTEIW